MEGYPHVTPTSCGSRLTFHANTPPLGNSGCTDAPDPSQTLPVSSYHSPGMAWEASWRSADASRLSDTDRPLKSCWRCLPMALNARPRGYGAQQPAPVPAPAPVAPVPAPAPVAPAPTYNPSYIGGREGAAPIPGMYDAPAPAPVAPAPMPVAAPAPVAPVPTHSSAYGTPGTGGNRLRLLQALMGRRQ